MNKTTISPDEIRQAVRDRYGKIADTTGTEKSTGCGCGSGGCCGGDASVTQLDQVSRLYQDPDVLSLPEEVTALSLGCGDPVAVAALQPGQTVLDLGSGGGIDCFLAAAKVGLEGRVIGVDMTPSMLEKARANQKWVGAENVEFRLGEIEHLPVQDGSVDVIISNCVINLSPDKPQVFREAFRALRPGGKLAVSDIVTDGDLPAAVKNNMAAWAGCVAGAWDVKDYVAAIEAAGFVDVTVEATYWDQRMIDEAIGQLEPEVQAQMQQTEQPSLDPQKAVYSARVTAWKPA
jgi:SAM-dependent methyltransferase